MKILASCDWKQQKNSFAFLTVADVPAIALQAKQHAAEVWATVLTWDMLLLHFFLPSDTGWKRTEQVLNFTFWQWLLGDTKYVF